MKKAVTIKSIAEQLNLSRNTVAKALNGQYVPDETRERVIKKAQEMGYKSLNMQHFESTPRRYRILLVSSKPLNNINYFIPLIDGIEEYCFQHNYELFQYIFNSSRMNFSEFASYVKELNVDGIIAIECFDKNFILKLLNLGKPVVFNDFTCSHIQSDYNYDVLSANDEQSIRNIVSTLRKQYNLSRFTFVGDRDHCRSFRDRYFGMCLGLLSSKTHHARTDDILCSDDNFDYGKPEDIKTEILKLKYRPDCYICCNDFVARTVCNALKLLNQSVPDDVMIVGFDNVAEAYSIEPTITSFSVDKKFLGIESVRLLISRIENPTLPSRNVTVTADPILRKSTDRPVQ